MSLVAVRTVPPQETAATFEVLVPGIIKSSDMTGTVRSDLGMALLAELGTLFFEQGSMHRTMRKMAQAAVFRYRIVFPEVGASFFSMAVKTIVIQAQLPERGRSI